MKKGRKEDMKLCYKEGGVFVEQDSELKKESQQEFKRKIVSEKQSRKTQGEEVEEKQRNSLRGVPKGRNITSHINLQLIL